MVYIFHVFFQCVQQVACSVHECFVQVTAQKVSEIKVIFYLKCVFIENTTIYDVFLVLTYLK